MFNRTILQIGRKVRDNLFNPVQDTSPQLWHVPTENVFTVTQIPDLAPESIPRVVFALGPLESDLRKRVEAFNVQPEQKTVTEQIHPEDHGFAQTYTLQNKPLKPMTRVRVHKTDGTRTNLSEIDDFLVDYNRGQITLREDVHDITRLVITYQTGEITGPASTILMTQFFYIQVTAPTAMKAEAIAAIIIGVIEAFKEEILAKPDKTLDGLNVITYLNPIDIQLVNKVEDLPTSDITTSVTLNYQVPGMMRIVRKIPEEDLSIIEKIYHPDVVESEQDVLVRVDIPEEDGSI